jgi:hypothetical protein
MAAARLTAQNGCQMCQILVGCVDSFTKCNCNDLMIYLQYRCHPELSLLGVWLAKKEEGIHVPSMMTEFNVKGPSFYIEESDC